MKWQTFEKQYYELFCVCCGFGKPLDSSTENLFEKKNLFNETVSHKAATPSHNSISHQGNFWQLLEEGFEQVVDDKSLGGT